MAAKVLKCAMDECAYNVEGMCHAVAMNVGNGYCPRCETFNSASGSGRGEDTGRSAEVGACKVSSCLYNVGMDCQADGIVIDGLGSEPQCMTFQPRCIANILAFELYSANITVGEESGSPEIYIG